MGKAPRRRWFQFGLRQLLLLMAVIALAGPWLPAAYSRLFPPEPPGCPVCGRHDCNTPWYQDHVEYYAPGPEFKLSRECAAQKALELDEAQTGLVSAADTTEP